MLEMAKKQDRSLGRTDSQEQLTGEIPPISRRDFLKAGVAGFAFLAGAGVAGDILEIVVLAEEGELPLSKGVVVVDKKLCSGCRTCEAVCTNYNSQGRASSSLARVILEKDYLKVDYETNTCFQCVEPLCLDACPVDAIVIDKKSGTNARIIDEQVCIGSKDCIDACGSIFTPPRPRYDVDRKVAVKCHLCFGSPQCVKFCPYGALQFKWSDHGIKTGFPIIEEG
jgi:Fe-S-cluster-containing dehydrogenase component